MSCLSSFTKNWTVAPSRGLLQLYSADKSAIKVLGRTAPISLRFTSGEPMQVSFLVIPSKGKNHLILGREFMLKYYVLVDLVRQ